MLWNQSLTPFKASLVTPRSYQGTRSLHEFLSASSRKTCRSALSRITGCAATRAMKSAKLACRLSIAADFGSSLGIRVLLGGAGTMIPSMDPRSIFHNHSKSLYRRVTHPLVDLYCGSVVQYVTLYSTCLDKPSPTLCGSLTSTCSVPVGSSYPAGAVTDTEGGSGLGPTASETPRVPRLPGDFGAVPDVWVAEGEAGVSMAETGPGREPPPETMREPRSREGTRVDVCWASEESGGAPTSRGSFKTERYLLQLASDVRLLSQSTTLNIRDFVVGKFCLVFAGFAASSPATSANASPSFSHSTQRTLSRSKKYFSDFFVILQRRGDEVVSREKKRITGNRTKSGVWRVGTTGGWRSEIERRARTCLPCSRFPATCAFRASSRCPATSSSFRCGSKCAWFVDSTPSETTQIWSEGRASLHFETRPRVSHASAMPKYGPMGPPVARARPARAHVVASEHARAMERHRAAVAFEQRHDGAVSSPEKSAYAFQPPPWVESGTPRASGRGTPALTHAQLDAALAVADALRSDGLSDDAERVLRTVLKTDPGNARAAEGLRFAGAGPSGVSASRLSGGSEDTPVARGRGRARVPRVEHPGALGAYGVPKPSAEKATRDAKDEKDIVEPLARDFVVRLDLRYADDGGDAARRDQKLDPDPSRDVPPRDDFTPRWSASVERPLLFHRLPPAPTAKVPLKPPPPVSRAELDAELFAKRERVAREKALERREAVERERAAIEKERLEDERAAEEKATRAGAHRDALRAKARADRARDRAAREEAARADAAEVGTAGGGDAGTEAPGRRTGKKRLGGQGRRPSPFAAGR